MAMKIREFHAQSNYHVNKSVYMVIFVSSHDEVCVSVPSLNVPPLLVSAESTREAGRIQRTTYL